MNRNLILLTLLLGLSGCASIKHTREVVTLGPDGKTPVASVKESEGARAFLMRGEISKVKSTTKDGPYSHNFSTDDIKGQGDAEMIKAIIESTGTAVSNGIGEAAKAAIKP